MLKIGGRLQILLKRRNFAGLLTLILIGIIIKLRSIFAGQILFNACRGIMHFSFFCMLQVIR